MVIGVTDHALGCAQRQHVGTHPPRIGPVAGGNAECGGEFGITHRGRAPMRIEGELHLQDGGVRGVLQNAVPVTEPQLTGVHPPHLAGAAIQQQNPAHAIGHLDAVGADVLHRRGSSRAGDTRKAFQPAKIGLHRLGDDGIPVRPGLGPQRRGLDRDPDVGQNHHGEVGQIVGDDDVGTTPENQCRLTGSVQGAQRGNDLLGADTGDHAAGNRPDPQRRQWRQRHAEGDLRSAEILP